ncbi:MAG: hypothetical protein LBE50_03940 [Gallionellaceae bacterium]|jgi:hypothetical protein|nr:hypothetical protein [Gallionellaceae bacterium]
MKTTINLRRVFRDSVRLYFAPLTGAFNAVRSESRRISREQQRRHENRETPHAG